MRPHGRALLPPSPPWLPRRGSRDPADLGTRGGDLVDERLERHRLLARAAAADGDCLLGLLLTPDRDQRRSLDLGVANALAERLVAIVDLDTSTRVAELRRD